MALPRGALASATRHRARRGEATLVGHHRARGVGCCRRHSSGRRQCLRSAHGQLHRGHLPRARPRALLRLLDFPVGDAAPELRPRCLHPHHFLLGRRHAGARCPRLPEHAPCIPLSLCPVQRARLLCRVLRPLLVHWLHVEARGRARRRHLGPHARNWPLASRAWPAICPVTRGARGLLVAAGCRRLTHSVPRAPHHLVAVLRSTQRALSGAQHAYARRAPRWSGRRLRQRARGPGEHGVHLRRALDSREVWRAPLRGEVEWVGAPPRDEHRRLPRGALDARPSSLCGIDLRVSVRRYVNSLIWGFRCLGSTQIQIRQHCAAAPLALRLPSSVPDSPRAGPALGPWRGGEHLGSTWGALAVCCTSPPPAPTPKGQR
mmetsp:Transcript_58317/g.160058  ORF Transcript_58317/g.160058 Transcript_58317/m.160058 type:complete len:376 (-) Transcript_58317:156-1283(-)